MDLRDVIVSAARALVGLTEPSIDLGKLVDPGGPPAHELAVERESLCMLVARGLWLQVFDVPTTLSEADRAYVNGSIPRVLGNILDAAGARRVPTLDDPPTTGDGVWYAAHGALPEHVDAAIVEVEEDPAGILTLTAVAGGERWTAKQAADGECPTAWVGHETIAALERTLRWNGTAWVCETTGRTVRWVLAADRIAARFPLLEA